jgi:hypothetical protein
MLRPNDSAPQSATRVVLFGLGSKSVPVPAPKLPKDGSSGDERRGFLRSTAADECRQTVIDNVATVLPV